MAFFHQWMVIIITKFVCVQCITPLSSKLGNVMWKITSSPIEFGKTAELTCLITNTNNDCTHELRQWIGGQQYTSICQNMRCSDGSKYHAKLETPCLYTLIISNFSMYDVNCDYACVYGLRSYRKHLQLNSKEFVSIPHVIHTNVSMTGGYLDIKVFMEDVYPSPKCHALLVGMDITNKLFTVSLPKGLFYHVELDLLHHTDACSGNITIYCQFGNNEVTALNEYIGDCKDIKTESSISFGGQIVSIIAGVSVCIAVLHVLWMRKRQGHYNSEAYVEMEPLIDLPLGLMRSQEHDISKFGKLLKSSETEKRYFVRVMIVGKSSAGKTSLLRRLLKESIDDVSSTDGIDIVVPRCKINIHDGKWIIGKDESDDSEYRIRRGIINNERRFANNISNTNENDPFIMTETNRFDENKDLTNDALNQYATCGFWDFAGQKEFYSTHQAFLSGSAVYLVVADIADDISDKFVQQNFTYFHNIGEHIEFWFDSIHSLQTVKTQDNQPHMDFIDPAIIMVFTGIDKYEEEKMLEARKRELKYQLRKVLGDSRKYKHLRKTVYISNLTDSKETFEKLRMEISAAASQLDNWGERIPLEWIRLDDLIKKKKKNGLNFITLTDMLSMAKDQHINILDSDEMILFLCFQHESGNVIFFKEMLDFIILNPEWLVDAFRCLVSDKIDNVIRYATDFIEFVRTGKLSKTLMSTLFKLKIGSQFLEQRENLVRVMEKFDILVTKEELGSYIMLSMLPYVSFEAICQQIGVGQTNCKTTSWLCLTFEFLPPAFHNHVFAWYVHKYKPSKIGSGLEHMALFRGICVFDIDSFGYSKLMVTMSNDTIALQLLSFSNTNGILGKYCSSIRKDIIRKINAMKQSYRLNISYEQRFKCRQGHYFKDAISYQDLKRCEEYYCSQHLEVHKSTDIYMPWLTDQM